MSTDIYGLRGGFQNKSVITFTLLLFRDEFDLPS